MADQSPVYPRNLYLSPEHQGLFPNTFSNNTRRHQDKSQSKTESDNASSFKASPASAMNQSQNSATPFGFADDDGSFFDLNNNDTEFDIQDVDNFFGDIPGSAGLEANSEDSEILENSPEFGEKRKELDDGRSDDENEDSGKKRKESDDRGSRKPGRKPLTSEPTSVCLHACVCFFTLLLTCFLEAQGAEPRCTASIP